MSIKKASDGADFGQGGLLAFWDSMSEDQRGELVKNLEEFHATLSSLEGRGIAVKDKSGNEITLLKKDPDGELLIKIASKLKAAGVKIIKGYGKKKS